MYTQYGDKWVPVMVLMSMNIEYACIYITLWQKGMSRG